MSPVQLQKTLFLLGERRPTEVGTGYYSFRPYHYGPFDGAIYRDADELSVSGMIDVENPSSGSNRAYRLTAAGQRASERMTALPSAARDDLRTLVEWAQSLSFPQLVGAIYAEYPEMKVNSIFQDPDRSN